jgi:hypothetical protein
MNGLAGHLVGPAEQTPRELTQPEQGEDACGKKADTDQICKWYVRVQVPATGVTNEEDFTLSAMAISLREQCAHFAQIVHSFREDRDKRVKKSGEFHRIDGDELFADKHLLFRRFLS